MPTVCLQLLDDSMSTLYSGTCIPPLGVASAQISPDTCRHQLNWLEASMLRYLLLVAAFFCWSPSVFAEVCCPSGCVQDGARCIKAGRPDLTCQHASCPARPSGGQGGSPGSGAPMIVYPRPATPPGQKNICCDASRIPGGSYTKTCSNIQMHCVNANELQATCRSGRGLVTSTLPNVTSCLKIENINGELKCKKRANRPPMAC